MQDKGGFQENALEAAELAWFAKRLREGLMRTRGFLRAIKNDSLDGDDESLERRAQMMSAGRDGGAAWGFLATFFALFFVWGRGVAGVGSVRGQYHQRKPGAATYTAVEEAEAALGRLVRVRHRLDGARRVGEQSILVQGCTNAVQLLLDRVGMNARGTVRRVVKEKAASNAKEKRANASRKSRRDGRGR